MAKAKTSTTTVKHDNYGKNRQARLLKHLKNHANDQQAVEALNANKTVSTRKAPNEKLGWLSPKVNKDVDAFIRSKSNGSITKDHAVKLAKVFKLTRKATFHALAVLIPSGESMDIVYKNTSKLSNFKPKPELQQAAA